MIRNELVFEGAGDVDEDDREQWTLVVDLFRQVCPRRGEKDHDDRRFLEALHYFTVHNITWRALPSEFMDGQSVNTPSVADPRLRRA